MQLGGFGEWYQRARAAGGRYLTEDLSAPAINTPDVVAGHAAARRLLRAGDRAAAGHVRLQHGAGRLHRRPAGHLLLRPDHRRGARAQAGAARLRVGRAPLSAGTADAGQLQRRRPLRHELQDAEQGPRLGSAQVVDERRASRLLDGRLGHLSGARRRRGDGLRRAQRAAARRVVRAVPGVQRRAGAVRRSGERSRVRPRTRRPAPTAARSRPRKPSQTIEQIVQQEVFG